MEGLRAVCPELPMRFKALGSAPALHMPQSCLHISLLFSVISSPFTLPSLLRREGA